MSISTKQILKYNLKILIMIQNFIQNFNTDPTACAVSSAVAIYSLIFLIISLVKNKEKTFNGIALVFFLAIAGTLLLVPGAPEKINLYLIIGALYVLGIIAIPFAGSKQKPVFIDR